MKQRLTEGGGLLNRVQWTPIGSVSNISPSRIRANDMPTIERALRFLGRKITTAQINTEDSRSSVPRILPELLESPTSIKLPGYCAIRVGDNRSIILYFNQDTEETLLIR